MFISVHTILVCVFCTVVAVKLISTLLWPGPKKFVKRDYFVNNIIENVHFVIKKIDEDAISVPDILLPIPSEPPGQFWATSGWVRNMTSFKRTDEDISLQLNDLSEDVEFNGYLQNIKVTFNHFRINISNSEYFGSIEVEVRKNLFQIKLVVDLLSTGNCTTTLSQLVIQEFDDIRVNVSGTESDLDLTTNIRNWVSNIILILVRHRIEEYFGKVFTYVLAKQDFCINKPVDDEDY